MTILVTVGSTDFDALVRRMDELAPHLAEPVVMQIGSGRYVPRNAQHYFRYAPSLEPYLDQADLVVSHGGLGTIMEALRRGKRVVAVSNLDRYDAHQDDLLAVLAEAGHLLWCRDLGQLAEELQRARQFNPLPYQEPECRIHLVIRDFLAKRAAAHRSRHVISAR